MKRKGNTWRSQRKTSSNMSRTCTPTCGSVVELIALGVPVKVDLADLSYGAVILLDGDSWFKEESNSWSYDGHYMSQLDLAQWIRDSVPENVVLLYNGDVYK